MLLSRFVARVGCGIIDPATILAELHPSAAGLVSPSRLVVKLESLSGGSGVHVFLVLWKAARAVQSYAEKSITNLEIGGSDFAVLEALLHKGPLPVNGIGRKVF